MNKKRILIYLIGVIVFIVSIVIRQEQIRCNRNQPIVSASSQWQQNGKPVFVKKAIAEDIPLLIKLTLKPLDGATFEGYVPNTIQEKLSAGQGIYVESEDSSVVGSISEVSREITFDTGMFHVQAIFEKPIDSNSWQVVYANTGILRNVICVPDNAIDRENGKTHVWKVKEGRAIKQEIEIGEHNGYGAVVLKGLNEGDMVIYKGFTQLSENDPVNIVKNTDDSGAKQ